MINFFKKIFRKNKVKADRIRHNRGIQLDNGGIMVFTFEFGEKKEEAPEWAYKAFYHVWELVKHTGKEKVEVARAVMAAIAEEIEKEYGVLCFAEHDGEYIKSEDVIIH